MAKLILHIGDHKTGTSAIQRALASEAADGRSSGWLYPEAGRAMGAGHHNLPWEIAGDKRFRPAKGGWAAVAREIAAATPAKVILSSEGFEFRPAEKVAARLETAFKGLIDEVEVVIYLRAHAPRLMSSFAERAKRGIAPFNRDAFLSLMLDGRIAYAPRLSAWTTAAQKRGWRLTPRIYDPAHLTGGDVIADFAATAGLRALRPAAVGEATQLNASPSAAALRMILLFNTALEQTGGAEAARRSAALIAAAAMRTYDAKTPKPAWRSAEAARIRDALLRDAVEVDALLSKTHGLVPDFTAALECAAATAADDTLQDLPPDAENALLTAAELTATLATLTPKNGAAKRTRLKRVA